MEPLVWLPLAFYLWAAGLLLVSFLRGGHPRSAGSTVLLAVGLGLHLAALVAYGAVYRAWPLAGLGPALYTLAALLAAGALLAATWGHAGTVGLVLVPVVLGLTAAAIGAGVHPGGSVALASGAGLVLHVAAAFVGYVGLTVAFAAELMYLLQWRQLRGKRFGSVFRFFPALDTLDRIAGVALWVGFFALSVALVLGWLASLGPGAGASRAEVLWGGLTWAVFVAALAARRHRRGGGDRAAWVSVVGFGVVVLAYLVLRITSERRGFL